MEDMLRLALLHGGKQSSVELPAAATVGDLRSAVETRTGVQPQHQKLLVKGSPPVLGAAAADTALADAGVTSGARIMVIGSAAADVSEVEAAAAPPAPAVLPAGPMLSAEATRRRRAEGPRMSPYIGPIEVLPLPLMEHARMLMKRIASDAGIVGVLDKRKYRVGKLLELDPRQIKLAGLNKNRGEEILLRLRHPPPDFDKFLPYSEIRDTMLHELTHCVHGPHDDDFWALFRTLCKECKAMDWRSGGHRVGGRRILHSDPFQEEEEMPWWEATMARRLGGGGQGIGPAEAALARAKAREKEEEDRELMPVGAVVAICADVSALQAACGEAGLPCGEAERAAVQQRGRVVRSTNRRRGIVKLHVELPEQLGGREAMVTLPACVCSLVSTGPDTPPRSAAPSPEPQEAAAAVSPKPAAGVAQPPEAGVEQPPDADVGRPPVTLSADAAVAAFARGDAAALRAADAVAVLHTLLSNVAREPGSERFRTAKMSNQRVARALSPTGAVQVLEACGFARRGDDLTAPEGAAGAAAEAAAAMVAAFPWLRQHSLAAEAAADGAQFRAVSKCSGGVAVGGGDGIVRVYGEPAEWSRDGPSMLLGHTAAVCTVAATQEGCLMSADRDGRVIAWATDGAMLTHTDPGCGMQVVGAASTGAVTGATNGEVRVWPPALLGAGSLVFTARGSVTAVAELPSGGYLVASGQALAWVSAGVQIASASCDAVVRSACAVPCGGKAEAATCGNDGFVRLWDASGVMLKAAKASDGYLLSVAAADGSPVIVTGAADGSVKKWSAGLTPLQTFVAPASVSAVSFLPDDSIAAATEHSIQLWKQGD
eukprot:TRINITY_DN712_c0_g1_i1.p1 TRINITY_DN712_c0_g1~~TRINITY_DN712_c0_g1_i1.p1  ORF type:complete len:827 (+),score=308.93 TRINITY_DN712_c0_g1_i1:52-2532(+)